MNGVIRTLKEISEMAVPKKVTVSGKDDSENISNALKESALENVTMATRVNPEPINVTLPTDIPYLVNQIELKLLEMKNGEPLEKMHMHLRAFQEAYHEYNTNQKEKEDAEIA